MKTGKFWSKFKKHSTIAWIAFWLWYSYWYVDFVNIKSTLIAIVSAVILIIYTAFTEIEAEDSAVEQERRLQQLKAQIESCKK